MIVVDSDPESHPRSMTGEHEISSTPPVGRPAKPHRRGRLWLAGLALSMLVCAAVPGVLFARWFVGGTLAAGQGAASPSLAVLDYFQDTPVGGPLAGDEIEVNLFCDRNQDALHRQVLDLVKAAKRVEVPGKIAFDRAEEHPSAGVEAIDDDRATYTTKASWNYANINPARRPGEWMWWQSAYQDWTFHLVNDNGWRVCKVDPPDPCAPDAQLACDRPAPAVVTPSVTAKGGRP
ncbi:hypothetical protein [Rhizocola hellebori]|nr:hypothetical protein [Rhizocola hellebori]